MQVVRQLANGLRTHKRWAARVVIAIGIAVAVLEVYPSFPRDTEIELHLGKARRHAVELRVAYVLEGEELHGVSFGFPSGAPPRVSHTVRLPQGELQVRMELRQEDGRTQTWTRPLHTPVDGTVRFNLDGGST